MKTTTETPREDSTGESWGQWSERETDRLNTQAAGAPSSAAEAIDPTYLDHSELVGA